MANHLVEAGFDLNESPQEIQMSSDQGELGEVPKPIPSSAETPSSPRDSNKKGQARKVVKKQAPPAAQQYSPQFYQKFLRLMDKLKICDKDDFDVSKIELPDDFAAENRIRLLLVEIGKKGQVKPEDRDRLKRIIKNCGQIQKAMSRRDEQKPSDISEYSGYRISEDKDAMYNSSPLDKLRAKAASVFNRVKASQEPVERQQTAPQTTWQLQRVDEARIDEPQHIGVLDVQPPPQQSSPTAGHTFFKFL